MTFFSGFSFEKRDANFKISVAAGVDEREVNEKGAMIESAKAEELEVEESEVEDEEASENMEEGRKGGGGKQRSMSS